MGKKKVEEIFDIPETKISSMVSDMKKSEPVVPAIVIEKVDEPSMKKEQPAKKKNNVSDEGKAKMLANLKKGREARKININKQHEIRQNELKSEIAELKSLVKETISKKPEAPKEEPKKIEAPKEQPKEPQVKEPQVEEKKLVVPQVTIPVLQPKASMPYIIKSNFKKPSYW